MIVASCSLLWYKRDDCFSATLFRRRFRVNRLSRIIINSILFTFFSILFINSLYSFFINISRFEQSQSSSHDIFDRSRKVLNLSKFNYRSLKIEEWRDAMDNRSHKSSTSVYDNVFISNTSRYFIGHLIFPALFFFLFPRTVQRKRREIRGVNLLTPLMAVEKQRWKKIVAAESHTTT